MSAGSGRNGPFPWCIASVMKGWGQRDEVGGLSRGEAGHGLGDGGEVVLVGPTGGEADHDAAGSDQDLGGDFDQPRAPRFDVTFAERVAVAMTLEEAAAVGFGGEIVRFGQLVRRELPGHRRVSCGSVVYWGRGPRRGGGPSRFDWKLRRGGRPGIAWTRRPRSRTPCTASRISCACSAATWTKLTVARI